MPRASRPRRRAVRAAAPPGSGRTARGNRRCPGGGPLPEGALARLGSLRWRAGAQGFWPDAQANWLTWAPDGNALGAVADGDVCLFDVTTGKLTKRIRPMTWPAERAAFAPDGKR